MPFLAIVTREGVASATKLYISVAAVDIDFTGATPVASGMAEARAASDSPLPGVREPFTNIPIADDGSASIRSQIEAVLRQASSRFTEVEDA